MPRRSLRAMFYASRARKGSVAVIAAITLTVLIGFVGLGTDVVYALNKQRQMQAVASAAAFSGAVALAANVTGRKFDVEARGVAAAAGFVNDVKGVVVTPLNPPQHSASYNGVATAVEVTVSQPQTLPLVDLLVSGTWNVSARAVAAVSTSGGGGDGCVMALDPRSTANVIGVNINNGANVSMPNCSMIVNTASNTALKLTATLNAKSVKVAGSIYLDWGGQLSATSASVGPGQTIRTPQYSSLCTPSAICQPGNYPTNQQPVSDPYSGTPVPTTSTFGTQVPGQLQSNCAPPKPSCSLTPGVYNNGIAMGNNAVVSMAPGVYIVDGGVFSVQGGVTLNGTGVTIVLGKGTSGYATVNIGNGVKVTLSAPTSGATSGLLFFQDPQAPTTGVNSFQGGATEVLTGALYFPHQTVQYSNGTTNASTCTQLLAYDLQFVGGSVFNSNCGTAGVNSIGGSTVITVNLVE
jgi:hypothetical protein